MRATSFIITTPSSQAVLQCPNVLIVSPNYCSQKNFRISSSRRKGLRFERLSEPSVIFAVSNREAPAPSAISVTRESQLGDARDSRFDWANQWHPVRFLEEMVPMKLYTTILLEKELVFWKDKSNALHCLEDRCPHRLAPLSSGQLMANGRLECLYHGWQFESSGKCVEIPFRPDEKAVPPSLCARAYPIAERQGLVYIWLGEPAKADTSPVPFVPELDDPSYQNISSCQFHRDRPYDFSYHMENVFDPTHVMVTHRAAASSSFKQTYNLKVAEESPAGFKAFSKKDEGTTFETAAFSLEFQAPSIAVMRSTMPGGRLLIVVYSSISSEGSTITLARWVRNFPWWTFPAVLFLPNPLVPRWSYHRTMMWANDQDAMFLTRQEDRVRAAKLIRPTQWSNMYKLVPTADRATIAFLKWFDHASKSLPFAHSSNTSDTPPSPSPYSKSNGDPRLLRDRYNQHVVNCTSCQRATRVLTALVAGGAAVAFLALGAACVLAWAKVPGPAVPVLVALSLISALTSTWAYHFRKAYYFLEGVRPGVMP